MILPLAQANAQPVVGYRVAYKALDVGVYDYSKARKEPLKVFYWDEAQREFDKLLEKDLELRNIFIEEYIDSEGNLCTFSEREVYEYYPDHGIILETGGHGHVSAFDVNRKTGAWGSPEYYSLSPSGKYRLSGLKFDGMVDYFLEENRDGEYVCVAYVYFEDRLGSRYSISGCYWEDEETIHFLRAYSKGDGSIYHIGYSGKFVPY